MLPTQSCHMVRRLKPRFVFLLKWCNRWSSWCKRQQEFTKWQKSMKSQRGIRNVAAEMSHAWVHQDEGVAASHRYRSMISSFHFLSAVFAGCSIWFWVSCLAACIDFLWVILRSMWRQRKSANWYCSIEDSEHTADRTSNRGIARWHSVCGGIWEFMILPHLTCSRSRFWSTAAESPGIV